MSNKSLFRFAGWAAILSIVFSFGLFALISGGRGVAFTAVSIIAALFTAVVLYGLFVFHRRQAAALSLVMLVLGIVGLILENVGSGPETSLGMITSVIYGVAFLLVGYLGYGNAQMPRWLAICAYIVGGASLATAGANVIGQATYAGSIPLLLFAAWIVWSVGIWRWFLKTAAA